MNRTTQVYRDPPSEIRWYWIFIVSRLYYWNLLEFISVELLYVNIKIGSRHLNDISKGIFCIITWSLCLILTSFFVPICVHMTRADYEWPFRKPLIWYDEFLRVTWERINGGNSMEMHLHPVFIHWKIKCHCFCWLYCLFLRFKKSRRKKIVLIEFLELQKNENKLMNIFKEATYSISL